MPNILFDALLGSRAESPSPFMVCEGGQIISYAQFHDKVAQFANALTGFGVQTGDRVTVQVAKSPEALALYFATIGIGAVFSPLNIEYTAGELEYFIENARPSLVVCDPSSVNGIQSPAKRVGASVATLAADGTGSLMDQAIGQSTSLIPADRTEDDLAAILYTSGTTGRSKGAMLTHANLLSNARTLVGYWRFTRKDVLLHALPIFHTHGLFVATHAVALADASMIFQSRFVLDDLIAELPNATTMMGVPTFYTRLLSDDRFNRELVSNMRLFISGSAPLLAETHQAFEERTGHRILERYGMTEATMITSNPYDGERRAGTVGFALPGIEVRICEAKTGSIVEDGEIGILEVSGPNVFKGYWEMPQKTQEEFRSDGYFITGDMARKDEHGYITIVGRDKDLIISGGYNIYPKEIEQVIDKIPGVVESAVIGVPHPDFGEAVVAIVVSDKPQAIAANAILETLSADIARFKRPRHVEIVDALPRNTMGKVQKEGLRNAFRQLFAGQSSA